MIKNDIVKNLSVFREFADAHLSTTSPLCDGSIWNPDVKYYMVQEYRYYLMLKAILKYFPEQLPSAIDLGCYPGDIGVLLRKIYGDSATLYGCGLKFTENFQKMALNYYNQLLYTELDPENPLGSNASKTDIELPEKSVDLIVAGEIFEHLYNPLHFISECSRILSDNGIIILTTDNLKYIGNILGILRNKSPFSELKNSHIFLKDEWRPHERLYFRDEIIELFNIYHLKVEEHFFFDNYYEKHERLPLKSKINQLICKSFYIFPSFRPRHFFIFRKHQEQC